MTGAKALLLITICSMKYTREDYERFLLAEIDAQKNEYQDLVFTRALVLKARGEIFVGRYLSVQGDGMLIFKVRNSDSILERIPIGPPATSRMRWAATRTGGIFPGQIFAKIINAVIQMLIAHGYQSTTTRIFALSASKASPWILQACWKKTSQLSRSAPRTHP